MYYVGVTCHIIQPGPFKTSIVDPGEMQFALQESYDATDSEVRAFYGQQWLDKCEKFSSIYTCRIYLNILLSFFHTILQVKDYYYIYHAKKWGEVATTRNGEDILLGGLKKKRVTPKMMCLMNFSGA